MRLDSLTPSRLVVALLASGVIGGASVSAFNMQQAHADTAPVATATTTTGVPVALPDFSQITRDAGPAVVNISVVGKARNRNASMDNDDDSPFGGDPFAQYFFRHFGGPGMQQQQQPRRGRGGDGGAQVVRGQSFKDFMRKTIRRR